MSINEFEEQFIEMMAEEKLISMLGKNSWIEVMTAAKKMTSTIESMVNNFMFDKCKIADEVEKNQSCMTKVNYLSMAFVKRLASNTEKWMYDDRNKESVEKAKQICSTAPDAVSAILSENGSSEEIKHLLDVVADTVGNQAHRTLQQTFAGFCFYILHRGREKKKPYYKELLAFMSDTFYRCWMI